ncbi:MAG: NusB antitermination factor [Chthonomonadaceae bacterium]|nr:NusB antitermination factor [Chthonomonadaceae bacterium]
MDVGKVSLTEAEEAAMERLRQEFVQRGSRTASGSMVEQGCLEYVTGALLDVLPTLTIPMERAVVACIEKVLIEAPYWQEMRVERAFKNMLPGVLLSPPRLLLPSPDPLNDISLTRLTPAECRRLRQFAERFRSVFPIGRKGDETGDAGQEALQKLLEVDLRTRARAFVKTTREELPLGMPPGAFADWLLTRREEFNTDAVSRWEKVTEIAQKQAADWMRVAAFTVKLVQGTQAQQAEIDRPISELATGWGLERLVSVDRNILRMAAFEMLFLPGIPTSASINEAVELAKKYSTAESGRFVNGVLGALATKIGEKPEPPVESTQALGIEAEDTALDLPDIAEIEENETE